ncbi:double zinc ribbon domain-containing protein, partial [Eggerthella lenta]
METTLNRRGIRARTAGAGHESAVCGAWKAPCYPRRMTIARTTLALAPARPTAREAGACPRVPRRERLLRTAGLYGRGAAEAIAETLWPTRCAVCDTPGEVLCAPCSLNLSHIDWWRACPRCGAPFGRVQCSECNDVLMSVAGRDEPPFDACTSAVAFDDAAARIVRTWKDA